MMMSGAFLFSFQNGSSQTVIPLYTGEIPNARPGPDRETAAYEEDSIWTIRNVSRPDLTVYLPAKKTATGIAVVVVPGGGYGIVAAKHEGYDVAEKLVAAGIAAFVLKYRLPDDSTMIDKEIGPLQDAQRAMLIVRSRAKEWGIKPDRIGIMGFSAGGHLASTAGTHFQKSRIENPGHIPLRPDFMILVYPVISFNSEYGHMGSAHNLLGPDPSPEKIKEYSNELQVTDQTPPAFLVHARDDDAVPVKNSLVFAEALRIHHVPVEILLYDGGGHGFGLNNRTSQVKWIDSCIQWIKKMPWRLRRDQEGDR